MRKGGQRTQVNLPHTQNLAADTHPVSFTLVSARISANTLAFVYLADKKPALHTIPLEEKSPGVSVLGSHARLDVTPCRLLAAVFLLHLMGPVP